VTAGFRAARSLEALAEGGEQAAAASVLGELQANAESGLGGR